MAKLISTNPSKNYEILGEVEKSTEQEIADKVKKANQAKLNWKELGVLKRVELLRKIHAKFESRKEEIPILITKEMGKPIKESMGEVTRTLAFFKHQLDNAEK